MGEKRKKFILSVLLIFLFLILRVAPSEVPYFDRKGDEYFKIATEEAVAIYAVARITNAVVSVAKETEMEISPFGVGITVHVGQLLDPLDDATERLSAVLTMSIAILGIMKISKEILQVYTFKLISYLLILLIPGLWIKLLRNFSRTLLNIVIILLAVRFALPVCGIINDFLYREKNMKRVFLHKLFPYLIILSKNWNRKDFLLIHFQSFLHSKISLNLL